MQFVKYTHGSFPSYTDVDVRALDHEPKFTDWPDAVGKSLSRRIKASYGALRKAESEFAEYAYELSCNGALDTKAVRYESQEKAIAANCVGD